MPTEYSDVGTIFSCPKVSDLDQLDAHVAVIGAPIGRPYSAEALDCDQANAPDAIRAASGRFQSMDERFDFDVGGTVLDGREIKVVDCGNVTVDREDLAGTSVRIENAIRKILNAGAVPIVLGGDHSIPIPVLKAYSGHDGQLTIIQIDAHIDWRDEVHGVTDGYSSPMRRASEMAHVGEMFQIGIRGQGSAGASEVRAATEYGAHIVSAYDLHEVGMQGVLDRIPDGGNYYITLDADGMDPSVMPAVAFPAPGGVLYHQLRALLQGLVRKGRVVGMDIVEMTPSRDVNDVTAIAAGRVINMIVGALARSPRFLNDASRPSIDDHD
ncbi:MULTISPECIES: agmatinase [Hyphomicrobiales]|jgi:agmatinase|uniref:agmatinase n=1 Tax=Hyphomicrobiales TaxID=356 RepID=UPI002165BDBA|nr:MULTISPECIES: agmatinase [Hyphomicrobiales]MCR5944124.1 arginase [Ochrobactrum sp. XJ1]MDG3580141.1 agmatinase [Rhizobium sp. YJ-22]UVV71045.1 agmatinase [Brucella anthropi]